MARSLCIGVDNSPLKYLRIDSKDNPYISSETYKEPLPMGRGENMLMDNKGNKFPKIALYSKPVGVQHFMTRSKNIDKYMDEKEWRFVPTNAKIIHEHQIGYSSNSHRIYFASVNVNSTRAVEAAKKEGYPNLRFTIEDLTHIVVGFDSEISQIIDLLHNLHKDTATNSHLNLLYSRVTSYETLERDYFSR